jgi:hypothetical protein
VASYSYLEFEQSIKQKLSIQYFGVKFIEMLGLATDDAAALAYLYENILDIPNSEGAYIEYNMVDNQLRCSPQYLAPY